MSCLQMLLCYQGRVEWLFQRPGVSPKAQQETQVQYVGWKDPMEKEMTTHSSLLAWEIPWTEELGGLQSMGSQESDTTEHSNNRN